MLSMSWRGTHNLCRLCPGVGHNLCRLCPGVGHTTYVVYILAWDTQFMPSMSWRGTHNLCRLCPGVGHTTYAVYVLVWDTQLLSSMSWRGTQPMSSMSWRGTHNLCRLCRGVGQVHKCAGVKLINWTRIFSFENCTDGNTGIKKQ
jgi:hypothetical protein